MLLEVGGSVIGGFDGATLAWQNSSETVVPETKDYWPHLAFLVSGWNITAPNSQYLESSAEIKGSGAALTYDGVTINGWTECVFDTTIGNVEVTDIDDANVRSFIPGQRTGLTMTVRGNYYDHEATLGAGHKEIYTNYLAGTKHTVALTFGSNQSYQFTAGVESYRIIPGSGNAAVQFEAVFRGDGSVTSVTTGAQTGFAALLTAAFATTPTSVSVVLSHSVDHTMYSGTGLMNNISITVPATGTVKASVGIDGTGALTAAVET